MYTYRLKQTRNDDDANPRHYSSARAVQVGDVIQLPETGFWHVVLAIHTQKTGTRLDLSEPGQSAADASLLAEQRPR